MAPRLRLPAKRLGAPTLGERASGLLLHPTSLPNRFPIGDLGPSAYAFADFLERSGQRWWQMLPLGPVGAGNSPYQSLSAFAGNPLLVSLEPFVKKGWLPASALRAPSHNPDRVNYDLARAFKGPRLKQAFERFSAIGTKEDRRRFEDFRNIQGIWLEDFALFRALMEAYPGKDWRAWDPALRAHDPAAVRAAHRRWAPRVNYHAFVQWQFSEQWRALRNYCGQRRIGLIGDLPIFVASFSADVWSHPEIFRLRRDGSPEVVAGVPPDYFSRTGQMWGNPHYRWNVLRREGYRWWLDRLAMMLSYFDAVRIDHFIGFVRYYEIPSGAKTAENGRFRAGPGAHFFKVVRERLGSLPLIAEDLGTVTPAVKELRDQFRLPGMKVLQFAFGKDPEARTYQPHNYPRRCVVYTGTHDNDTIVGWFHAEEKASSTRTAEDIRREKEFTLNYSGSDGQEIHWDLIRLAMESEGAITIFPVQDPLGLGSKARMNRPGTPSGNWEWRLRPRALTAAIARRLRFLSDMYQRL